jgi:hypothetical protein
MNISRYRFFWSFYDHPTTNLAGHNYPFYFNREAKLMKLTELPIFIFIKEAMRQVLRFNSYQFAAL